MSEGINMGYIITIDGPAASGKSSVSRELARRLGCFWVSTGAYYRGLAFIAKKTQVDLHSPQLLAELASSDKWRVGMDSQKTKVFFENKDVTEALSEEQVGNAASLISHYPEVRQALLIEQRKCGLIEPGLVAEGRDCGTVIFPQADSKIYLTASSEHRAARRAQELGMAEDILQEQQKQRDHQDSSRKIAPLQIPESALVLDTTYMSFDEVVNSIEKHIQEKMASKLSVRSPKKA